MEKWEYLVREAKGEFNLTLQYTLDDFGKEGWELVNTLMRNDNVWIIMKRKKRD